MRMLKLISSNFLLFYEVLFFNETCKDGVIFNKGRHCNILETYIINCIT